MPAEANPLVSIITPTYNHERFIGPCIESVLAQTYSNWEQIIIDDGSTDGTRSVVERYKDKRIRYIRQENQGIEALAHTYNRALSASHGSLIAILEGDDTWPQYKLATMTDAFIDPFVALAYGEMKEIDVGGKLAERSGSTARKYRKLPQSVLFNDPVRSAIPYLLTVPGHSMIPASTVLMRRAPLDAIGGFQYVQGQLYTDFPTFILLALQGKFYFFSEVVGFRRMHASSATARFFEEMTERSHKHLLDLLATPGFQLRGKELAQVLKSWSAVGAGVDYRRGRALLLDSQWSAARSSFLGAMQLADLRVTMGAIVGWCLSWIHRDLEILYQKAGRPALRSGN